MANFLKLTPTQTKTPAQTCVGGFGLSYLQGVLPTGLRFSCAIANVFD
ncbi:MAG TPA: hypothetical protein V6C85_05955 [Allocoleopsis sp.]